MFEQLFEPPRFPGDDYNLHLTANQIACLYGLMSDMRKNLPQLFLAPDMAVLELLIMHTQLLISIQTAEPAKQEELQRFLMVVREKLEQLKNAPPETAQTAGT